VDDRQADPGEQAQLGRGRRADRRAAPVHPGGAEPGDHLGRGVPGQDRVAPHGVQRLGVRAVRHHLLVPVLDQHRPVDPARDGVDYPLELPLHQRLRCR
jgi:hypothetical protein